MMTEDRRGTSGTHNYITIIIGPEPGIRFWNRVTKLWALQFSKLYLQCIVQSHMKGTKLWRSGSSVVVIWGCRYIRCNFFLLPSSKGDR